MIAVRRATPDDAALLSDHRACVWNQYGEHDPQGVAAHVPVWTAWMRGAIARDAYVGFIAFDGDAVAGSACVLVHEAVPRPGYIGASDGRVHSVYVVPAMRRRGIARALMDALLAYAQTNDVMRLTLHPTVMSRALYTTLGFEPLDEMGLYFGP